MSTVKTLLDRMVPKGLVAARQVGPVWEYAVLRVAACSGAGAEAPAPASGRDDSGYYPLRFTPDPDEK